jgi:hypothetical protein
MLSTNLFSQKISKVTAIKGVAYISGDISPNQAKQQAINDAKLNALKAAGIEEHISSYQLLFTSQAKNDYSQFFNSNIQSEIQGAVKTYEIKSEQIFCKNDNVIVCEVVIDATIIKYDTKPDINFDANIEGIKAAYNNNEKLAFSIKTTAHCYLTIFSIADTEASVLYPNQYENQIILKPYEVYNFPFSKVDYLMSTEMKSQETNRLIFVFTKTQIPFIKMSKDQITTQETIFSWLYSIAPDKRKVEYYNTIITKN